MRISPEERAKEKDKVYYQRLVWYNSQNSACFLNLFLFCVVKVHIEKTQQSKMNRYVNYRTTSVNIVLVIDWSVFCVC